MTRREKVLATTLLTLLFVLGGGVLFHLFVYEPVSDVRTRLEAAQQQLLNKQGELAQEQRQIEQVLRVNPRLSQWQKISLPPRDPEAKKKLGVSPEELKRRHMAQMQVEYERYLSELLRAAGVRIESISVKPPDRRTTVTVAKGKEPPYERLAFTVAGKGTLDSTVRAMQEFHKAPLLHQVRNLSLGLATGSSSDRFRSAPGGLDINMTVEALLVAGAEERSALLPPSIAYPPRVLAEPGREYDKMAKRNMFTGIEQRRRETTSRQSEKAADVLRFIKLTMLFYNPDRRRWEATLYDQARGPRRVEEDDEDGNKKVSVIWERQLNTRVLSELTVFSYMSCTVMDGKVVLIDEQQMIFTADRKFYRLRCGDTLHPAVEKPLSKEEVTELGLDP